MKWAYTLLLVSVLLVFPPAFLRAQVTVFTLNRLDQSRLDSLATLAAEKIREAKLAERERKVLVMDFFRNSPGTSSQLGTILADRFSDSLAAYSSGMEVLDRKTLQDFLHQNWTTLEDFRSYEVCLAVARQLGATGAILGTLTENNSNITLTLHLEGFGPKENEDDVFSWRDRTIRFSSTEDMRAAFFQPGPNYSRKAEEVPEEPGVLKAGLNGVTVPLCGYCPDPDYSNPARAAKFQGTVALSIVVTAQGQVTGVYVLKGAPFGLTAQAISATKNWRFQPGQKDGKPVAVRVPIEITFRLF